MQDLKKNKRRINQSTLQHEAKESLNEELQEDIARSCKSKGCNCNKHDDECELECDCVCKPKHNHNHKHGNNSQSINSLVSVLSQGYFHTKSIPFRFCYFILPIVTTNPVISRSSLFVK